METNFAHQPYIEAIKKDKWNSERIFAAASAVKALEDAPGWRVVCELLGLVSESHEAQLIYGQSTDDATVSRLRGAVAGLKGAEVAAEAVAAAAEQMQANLESRQTAEAER